MMKRRIILYPGIVGDYEGAYDYIPEAEFDKEENTPGYHSQEWPNLGGYVVIDYDEMKAERDALILIKDEVVKLKKHLGPDGEYSIARADGEPMSWESLIISSIFEKIDEALKQIEGGEG